MKKPGSFQIPEQHLNLFEIIHDTSGNTITKITGFEVSNFVTLKEYKEYLSSIKKDSSEKFYLSQLPDTSIAEKKNWEKYIKDKIFDDYPALGISWESAMNFCRWKTLKENPDSIQFVYRLPETSEWISAYYYLEQNKMKHDLNQNYSDLTIDAKDESIQRFIYNGGRSPAKPSMPWGYDLTYFHRSDDPPAMKRKTVIGNSFLYQQEHILRYSFSYYADRGYRQIGFRYVKDFIATGKKGTNVPLLDYWKIK